MSQTKTRGMIYSSNVSDKNKGDGLLLECLTQKEGLWYTPRMSQTKTTGMIYSSNVSQKQGLLYTPRMSQTETRGMIYSSNASDKTSVMVYSANFLDKKQWV